MLLIVIDVQEGLDDVQYGQRNNPGCEANILRLLQGCRDASVRVVYTQHLSKRPGSPLASFEPRSAIKASVGPIRGESIFPKSTNSIFKSAAFASAVGPSEKTELVLAGIATDICVTACARDAHDLGFQVTVVSDACAAFERSFSGRSYSADDVHCVALASLAVSGIRIATTEALIQTTRPHSNAPTRTP